MSVCFLFFLANFLLCRHVAFLQRISILSVKSSCKITDIGKEVLSGHSAQHLLLIRAQSYSIKHKPNLKMYGCTVMFLSHLNKGNNFCDLPFALLVAKALINDI